MTLSLVTGADGFVGQHLVAELLRRGGTVVGAVKQLPPRLTTLSDAEGGRVQWVRLELERPDTIEEVIREFAFERVFHLAGLASASASFADPVSYLRVNALGTLLLLEALARSRRESGREPRIVVSGSAECYGAAAARHKPLTEDCPLEPQNPYGASKAAQEMLALQFYRSERLPAIVTRSFNHTGPGQASSFVAPQLAKQILEIQSRGSTGAVRVRDPEVRRDFTDVRDVVRAYIDLAERGEVGQVYNVCSGEATSVGEVTFLLAELAGVEVEVEVTPDRRRPTDIREMVGSYERLEAATGWSPRIGLRQCLADLLGSLRN